MQSIRTIALAVALLLTAVATARGKDESTAGARERYDEVRAAFPAPSKDRGIRFKGDIYIDGAVFSGTFDLTASPRGDEGSDATWLVRERMKTNTRKVTEKGGPMSVLVLSTLRADLSPVEGKATSNADGENRRTRWRQTDAGVQLTGSKSGRKVQEESIGHNESWLPGLGCGALFAKLALDAPGAYATTFIDPVQRPAQAVDLQIVIRKPEGNGRQAATVLFGRVGYEILFDKDGAIAQLTFHIGTDEDSIPLVIVPKGTKPAAARHDPFSKPAKNPKDAAIQATLAFVMRTPTLLKDAIRWERMHELLIEAAKLNSDLPRPAPFAEWKKAYVDDLWRTRDRKRELDPTKSRLLRMREKLRVVEVSDTAAKVIFPEDVKLEVLVALKDGIWKAIYAPVKPETTK